MFKDAPMIGQSKWQLVQNVHAMKMFICPGIDCRMMFAGLY
jgi:hypothetical protein